MAVINKGQFTPPVLRKETVPMPSLNGDVIIRELTMSERIAMQTVEDDSKHGTARMRLLLSLSVVDDEGQRLMTPEEWDVFGGKHPQETDQLFGKVLTISGYDGEANRKN